MPDNHDHFARARKMVPDLFSPDDRLQLALDELRTYRRHWRWFVEHGTIKGEFRRDSRKRCVLTPKEVAAVLDGEMPTK